MAADGRPALRRPPFSPRLGAFAILTEAFQLAPPLVELKALMPPPKSAKLTTTVPFGNTRGWPPMPESKLAGFFAGPHVAPPSVEVLMYMRSPCAGLSHWV